MKQICEHCIVKRHTHYSSSFSFQCELVLFWGHYNNASMNTKSKNFIWNNQRQKFVLSCKIYFPKNFLMDILFQSVFRKIGVSRHVTLCKTVLHSVNILFQIYSVKKKYVWVQTFSYVCTFNLVCFIIALYILN